MRALGIPDGEFAPPKLSFFLEAVPKASFGEDDPGDKTYTLLRIHIFDDVSTPYSMYLKLLDAMKDRHLGTIGVGAGKTHTCK